MRLGSRTFEFFCFEADFESYCTLVGFPSFPNSIGGRTPRKLCFAMVASRSTLFKRQILNSVLAVTIPPQNFASRKSVAFRKRRKSNLLHFRSFGELWGCLLLLPSLVFAGRVRGFPAGKPNQVITVECSRVITNLPSPGPSLRSQGGELRRQNRVENSLVGLLSGVCRGFWGLDWSLSGCCRVVANGWWVDGVKSRADGGVCRVDGGNLRVDCEIWRAINGVNRRGRAVQNR